MTAPTQPLSELTREAIDVLVRELGVARTLRFLGQYRTGEGDYTAERHRFLADQPLDEMFEEARRLDRLRAPDPAGGGAPPAGGASAG